MTGKFIFRAEGNNYDDYKQVSFPQSVQFECSDDISISQVLIVFKDFLRGCGFSESNVDKLCYDSGYDHPIGGN